MQTIRAIFKNGSLQPLDPVNLPDNTRFTVALLDSDDLSPVAMAQLAHQGGALTFLNEAGEGLYSESDGEAV